MSRLRKATVPMLVAAAIMGIVQLATAQSVDDWRSASESEKPTFKLVQSYHGTSPGTGNTLPKVEELKGMDGSWITWPGFLMKKEGGSRIFLQTTAPLEYKQKNKKKKITLTFKDTKVFLSNNKNPLVTLHFNTPLRKAYLKKSKKNAELVLELKQDAEISIMQMNVEDGYSYIFIDFPAGNYPVGGEYGNRPNFSGAGEAPSGADDDGDTQVSDDESPF